MTTPYKIGVIGAGNIGTAMAALLSQSSAEVWLTARGARLSQISAQGVVLDERGSEIHATPKTAPQLREPMDALFVCVKSQSLAQAIALNKAAITPETLVVPMVNGLPFWFHAQADQMNAMPLLDPDAELSRLLRPAQVLGAVLLMTVQMDVQGRATSSNTPTLSLGCVSSGADDANIEKLVSYLDASGVRTDITPAIREKVLVKLLANFTTNPLSALTGAMLDEIGTDAALRDIALALADEFRTWALGEGFELPTNAWLIDLLQDAGAFPTSMLQDALAGKPLELDAICRAPHALAAAKSQAMPMVARLLEALKTDQTLPLPKPQVEALIQSLHRPLPA
ncbi:ketopantoate reductase family protein [Pacificibacter marinus]|uniref:ketopantoate reductase family protein n=1 Tax=Pacificibacter marinus TaxID=658057 RepID=UPI001C079991|nr:2-dehydropantoate 2-reductase N-terminal domain-containing protein [Pacificibacter marinus]MBU2866046.1 NAD(P)-binding domain-containing protein [Pacificibacter marinus]